MTEQIKNIGELAEIIFELAAEAERAGEVPVASAVLRLVPDDDFSGEFTKNKIEDFINGENLENLTVSGTGTNRIIQKKDPTAHGEIIAIRNACNSQNSERLSHSFLVSMLEPCIMCSGAVILSRLSSVLYFAPALNGPGLKTVLEQNPRNLHAFNHYPSLHHLHVYEERASGILRSFFRARRTS